MPQSLYALQQAFLDLRFGMFLHFNMATFQDREWGDPSCDASVFKPTALDTDGWAEAAKAAGMTWGCLTSKHHDGFCIWPTRTRSAQSQVDVVGAYVESFRRAGLRTSLYYSILDLREDIRHFNVTPDKVQLVKDHLTELLTRYGPIDALIIDGWDAPWSRITYEEIPFREIYDLVKTLQPDCLVADLNAAKYPAGGLYYTDLKAFEQNAGQHLPESSHVPAFSCVTLTDGWFWKERDSRQPLKSTDQVVNEWLVPQNERHCSLILNAPPNREGRLAPNVVARLREIGAAWQHPGPAVPVDEHWVITTPNLATGRPIRASSSPDTVGPDMANDGDFRSAWAPEIPGEAWLEVDVTSAFDTIALVSKGVSRYRVEGWDGTGWREVCSGAAPSVEIRPIERTQSHKVRFIFSGESIEIAEIGLYLERP